MFKAEDYIVTLKGNFSTTNCGKENYCFKQRINGYSINPVIDLNGSEVNGNAEMAFDKKGNLRDWRYASEREIAEYDRLGKPYDITLITGKIHELW